MSALGLEPVEIHVAGHSAVLVDVENLDVVAGIAIDLAPIDQGRVDVDDAVIFGPREGLENAYGTRFP